ncbi:MAG: hypothetical protein ACLTE2_10045 [Eubacteriales bacterium]
MKDWLAVKDEEILHKMQSVDDWLDNGDEQLQQAVTEAQTAVQAAVSQANTAADRANQAVEQMAQVAGGGVEEAILSKKISQTELQDWLAAAVKYSKCQLPMT